MSIIYLDHTATKVVLPDVLSHYHQMLKTCYANPASIHGLGLEAEKCLEKARSDLMRSTGQNNGQLVFTSGGSESVNLAIKGFIRRNKRLPKRIITSAGEHAAVYETMRYLEQQGTDIEWLPLCRDGTVSLTALEKALTKPAALLSLIHVSNESGAVNPIADIMRLKHRLQPDLVVHLDAVQAYGKTPFHFDQMGIDMASGSGHKLGAPKGIGWLSLRPKLRLEPLIQGGGQQDGLRSGTENPPLASALAMAAADAISRLDQSIEKSDKLKHVLLTKLTRLNVQYIEIAKETAVPQILVLSFPGIRAETMVHALESKGIYVSSGSACSSKSRKRGNRVLQAMGLSQPVSDTAIRISLSGLETEEEMAKTAASIEVCCRTLIRG